MSGIMAGKRGLIMGLANDRSLAWGIAKRLSEHGAELAFAFQGEAIEKRVRPLAAEVGSDLLIDCDVSDMGKLDAAFAALQARWDSLDFVVHAIGFSDKNELRGGYELTYGSLGGVMVVLLFFFVIGLGVVTGAELNAALADAGDTALKGEHYEGPHRDELTVEEPAPDDLVSKDAVLLRDVTGGTDR